MTFKGHSRSSHNVTVRCSTCNFLLLFHSN